VTAGPATDKVITFLTEAPTAELGDGGRGGPGAPARVALATALTLDGLPPPRFAAVAVRWYTSDAPQRISTTGSVVPVTDPVVEGPFPGPGAGQDLAVPVDEVVVRGAEALAARWADGRERYKMMSIGRRNPALSRAEFVARWRAEAGRLGGDRIPDGLRGFAYVQDHPRGDDPPLDAVNEVWLDDLDALRRRAQWFAARPIPADLMSPPDCWSLYLRETVLRT
jgi:hypothetical protein